MRLFGRKDEDDSLEAKKNWYSDRYQTTLIQRNFLLLLTMISLAGIIVSVITVVQVTSSKSVEPFVIEIEEKTGITNVIRPLLKEKFAYDEALRRYFIMKYVNAREGYDFGSYKYNYYTVIRLLSTSKVYSEFRKQVAPESVDSPLRMEARGQRVVKAKSMALLEQPTKDKPGFTVQVRFALETSGNDYAGVKNLVATINFDYFDLSLTTEERDINPLGFQVTGYRIDEEVL